MCGQPRASSSLSCLKFMCNKALFLFHSLFSGLSNVPWLSLLSSSGVLDMLPVLKSQELQFGKGAAGERGQCVSLLIARPRRGGELLAAGGSGREQDFPEQGPAMALCCQCEGELMSFEPPVLLLKSPQAKVYAGALY